MCGIAGFNWSDTKLIKRMSASLAHRGPDASDAFVDDVVSLGHRRLAVVDLSPNGIQPMKFKHLVLVFNGEIFNYQIIKKQLQKKGHRFVSDTDTEVILHAYHQWGANCVKKFIGQWAFVMYDQQKRQLFLSRDRFGILPLYYAVQANQFIFASEIKAILNHKLFLSLNFEGFNSYWFQKYVRTDLTIYQQICQVPPGFNIHYNLHTNKLKLSRYYHLAREIEAESAFSVSQRKDKIVQLIPQVVTDQLLADVPVGTYLSGGLDSSLISALAKQVQPDLHTFSLSFPQKSYDESAYAQQASAHLKTHHHQIEMKVDDQLLQTVFDQLDQPFGDASIIPTYVLATQTKQHVTVALSGDGADEVFGGYDTYRAYVLAEQIPSALFYLLKPLAQLLPASRQKVSASFMLKRFVERYRTQPQYRHLNNLATFTDSQRQKLLLQGKLNVWLLYEYNNYQDVTQVQLNDIQNYLPGDILVKTDLASMMSGLEVRVPYLDHRLVPVALSLPESEKLDMFQGKKLLKQIARQHVPSEIVNRAKQGFTVPLSNWFEQSQLLQEYLLGETYYLHQWVDRRYVKQLWNQQQSKHRDNSRELWLVAVFNYWWNRWGRRVNV